MIEFLTTYYHDFQIYLALILLAYTLAVMLGLALRDLWRSLQTLFEPWISTHQSETQWLIGNIWLIPLFALVVMVLLALFGQAVGNMYSNMIGSFWGLCSVNCL
ncbi:MAG: hypothetical protein IIA89_14275 [Chloroflexi bacterium]|nr:hypothetical protein [Chloroflexota bacterium]